jgi:hypothetical protein
VDAVKEKKYSSDRRERMRELQSEGKMTAEHGKLGGRPRKVASNGHQKRAAAVVSEWVRDNPDQILAVIRDALTDPDATDSERLRAAKFALGIEGKESERERDELSDPNSARAIEAVERGEAAKTDLTRMLTDPISGERLRGVLAGILAEAGSTP